MMLFKYDINHSNDWSSILYIASFLNKIEWSTTSKAFRKSMKSAPT